MENLVAKTISPLVKIPLANSLHSERIKLVRKSSHHAKQIWEYIQRDHSLGGTNYQWVESITDVVTHVAKDPIEADDDVDYVIFHQEIAIGSVHMHTVSYANHKAEVGYGIEKAQEGKGFVSEALQLLLKEMKRRGFNKAVIACNKENIRSVRVAERNGFLREGLLVQDCVEDGVYRDSVIFGKLLRES